MTDQKYTEDEFHIGRAKQSRSGSINFAILRTAKLKTAAAIKGVSGHNSRSRRTDNADPNKKVENLVDGGPDLHATVMKKIEEAGAKYRSNSVLAQEIFLSASPEYFRPGRENLSGFYDETRMMQWKKESLEWLKNEFGGNIVDCRLHLDESTPHIHAVVVPLTEDGRLSARDVFSKVTLGKMQTGYARQLEPLGLQRGIQNSKAKHTDIKKYYQAVNSAEKIQSMEVEPPELMLRKTAREKYAAKLNMELEKKFKTVGQQAENAHIVRNKLKEYQRTAVHIMKENEMLKENLKEAANQARSTPLTWVLKKAGLEIDPKDKNQWIGAGYRISVKDQKFYDHNNELGGGGAIDLVKHLNQCDYKSAVAWLGQNVSVQEAAKSIRAEATKRALAFSKEPTPLCMPTPEKALESNLKQYLKEERKLHPSITDQLIEEGRIYAAKYKGQINAVFVCRNSKEVTGAEIKGLSRKFSGMARGSNRKNGAFMIGEPESKQIVFVESAIDAISYKQLNPEPSLVISTAGATSKPAFLKDLQQKQSDMKVTIAYDNDEKGQEFAKRIQKELPNATIRHPIRKDWNEQVKNPSLQERLRHRRAKGTLENMLSR